MTNILLGRRSLSDALDLSSITTVLIPSYEEIGTTLFANLVRNAFHRTQTFFDLARPAAQSGRTLWRLLPQILSFRGPPALNPYHPHSYVQFKLEPC